MQKYQDTYLPVPVEYKRGKPKEHAADVLQLCAQAICLEEMLVCQIEKGYLYYGETRKRTEVIFDMDLRQKVSECFQDMHAMYDRNYTPKVKTTKACRSCSLAELCLPKLNKTISVKDYMDEKLKEDEQ